MSSRYEKRFWQMTPAQKARAQAVEARRAPWRTALVKLLYAATPRWLLWTFVVFFVAALLVSRVSPAWDIVVYLCITLVFGFCGVTGLLQGWSFDGRARMLFTGFTNAALGTALLMFFFVSVIATYLFALSE